MATKKKDENEDIVPPELLEAVEKLSREECKNIPIQSNRHDT